MFQTQTFWQAPFDGIMGLGLSAMNPEKVAGTTSTPLEALKTSGAIQNAQVGFAFGRAPENYGEVTFGGPDTTKFNGDLLTINGAVDSTGVWFVPATAVTVGSQNIKLPQGTGAYLHTAISLIHAPKAVAYAIHQLIPNSQPDQLGGFTLPCDATVSITFTLGGKSFSVATQDIVGEPLTATTAVCSSNIVAISFDSFILGQAFLRNVYLLVDATAKSIGLAQLAQPTQTSTENQEPSSSPSGNPNAIRRRKSKGPWAHGSI